MSVKITGIGIVSAIGLNINETLESFIFDQQLFYFTPDTLIIDVNFYKPNISEEGFEKDLSWKPIVPKDSVLKFNQEVITMLKE